MAYAYSAIHNYEKAREYGERFLFEQDACHTIEQRELGNIFNMSDYRSVLFLLGQSCYHLGDFNSAQKYLNIFYRVNYGKDYGYAFSSHDSEALNYLGYTSLFKLQNIDKGLHCFEISALTMDNADSYTRLGDYYSNNYPEASSLGCWPLNFYLFAQDGKKKMNAMETVKTIVDSKYLNKSVVNNLCFDENYILGLCLQNGLCGLVRDTIQAIAFFKKVVQQQNVPQIVKENAWFQLGHLSKDKALKIKCFKSSADMGGVAALTPLCYEKYNSWDEAMKFAKSAGFNDYYFDVINTLPLGRSSEDYLKRAEIFYELYKKGYLFFDIHCYDSPKFMWNPYQYQNFISYRAKEYWKVSSSVIKETVRDEYKTWYVNTRTEASVNYYWAEKYKYVVDMLKNESTDKLNAMELAYLALCYYHGRGIDKDTEKAMELFTISANRNNEIAMTAIGNEYRKHGDYSKAIYWYKRAAHNGSKEGMRNLSLCYLKGLGVQKNEGLANLWMKQAAKLGDIGARQILE